MAFKKTVKKVAPARAPGPPLSGDQPRLAHEAVSDAVGGDITRVATVSETEVEEEQIDMVFPKEVRLTRDDHTFVVFRAGVNKVPASLADHWWLKANGVTGRD